MVEIALQDPPTRPGRGRRVGYAMTLTAAILFAANGAVSKVALQASDLGALRWTELRSTGAFLGLALVLAIVARDRLRVGREELPSLAFYGICGFAFVQWFYFVAIERLPISIGNLLQFTAPVLVALWARFAWHEPVRRRVWASLGLVLVGLALVSQLWDGFTLDTVGTVAALLAAVTLAIFYLAGERLVARREPLSLVCLAMGFATLFWAIVQPWWSFPFDALTVDADLPGSASATVPVWALALVTITVGTIVPFSLSVAALRRLPATTVGIVATVEPVFAAVVAWAWLDETLVAAQVLGGLVVLLGIVLAETARRSRPRARRPGTLT
jgi:drug/metabolite transporter (DMT)-like permease